MVPLLRVADLTDSDLDWILARAGALRRGVPPVLQERKLVCLVFLEPSLRTRVGFRVAAARLGWDAVEVADRRQSTTSMVESWEDTLRIVSGYSDVVVVRPSVAIGEATARSSLCPVVNGGDVGPSAEHPTQAIVDLFAIEELVAPVEQVHVAIVGDLRMRAVRSLLEVLSRRRPTRLSLVADVEHLEDVRLPAELGPMTRSSTWDELEDADVLYVAGIPHASLPIEKRNALIVTAARARKLRPECVLLSPMPMIDEMDPIVRGDPRNRMFEQSDLGLYARMAVLEHVVGLNGTS